ncbi:MAG: S-layer homology domain-containing protein [Candidatus Sericytochromatia bacterium]
MRQGLKWLYRQAAGVLACCLLLLVPAGAIQLVDGPAQAPLAGRVQLAIESFRILNAYPDKTFRGERPFTRYELADALWRSLSYLRQRYGVKLDDDPRIGMIFQAYLRPGGDIPERHWAAPALSRVLGYGLMNGTADLQFHGPAKVSRYMLALSLERMLEWLQVAPVKLQSRQPRDVPSDHWAAEAVNKLVEAGIFELDASGNFAGEQPATRYDLAETLVRLLQQVDLVAQQRPLVPKEVVVVPVAPAKRPDGRVISR